MNASPWEEKAAAYALDALDATERIEFEALLANSSDARRDVAELREVVSLLAYAAPPSAPPASLRARVLAESQRVRPIGAGRSAPDERAGDEPRSSSAWAVVPYLALAASLAGLVVLGSRYVSERDARSTLAAATDSLRQALASRDMIINALLAPEVESVKLTSSERPPSARMYWNRKNGAGDPRRVPAAAGT